MHILSVPSLNCLSNAFQCLGKGHIWWSITLLPFPKIDFHSKWFKQRAKDGQCSETDFWGFPGGDILDMNDLE